MSSTPRQDFPIDHAVSQAAWLRQLALAIVRDAHEADDVAQEAWVAFLRKRPDPGSSLGGWFRGVMRNLVRTRSREVGARSFHELSADEKEIRDDCDPSFAVARLETQEELLRAVRELGEPYRTVVLLRWFEGLDPIEVARRTKTPIRTVHTRTSRALVLLRERLDRRSSGDRTAWMSAWMAHLNAPNAGSLSALAMATIPEGGEHARRRAVRTKLMVSSLALAALALAWLLFANWEGRSIASAAAASPQSQPVEAAQPLVILSDPQLEAEPRVRSLPDVRYDESVKHATPPRGSCVSLTSREWSWS
jgi:RNA polymerase sigma-70 factor (ECF subfamily)